jgi:tetratricopeptide (TPR) repeat protein
MATGLDDSGALAATAAGQAPERPSQRFGARLPERGERVGRYVIEHRIGHGGMGAVYRANDPELDRPIAIKLIRPDIGANELLEQRLVRESKAMAQLAHENVLTVHDIGRFEGQMFIAMELAPGGTLRDWLEAGPREWRDVVARFALAARGLRAAHEAGLVHRDFKPENVLLTADGGVRVADFGLVGSLDGEAPPTAPQAIRDTPVLLTQLGARMGTPRYMAPEQHTGSRAGAAADQFAFGIALYEALYNDHPFGGTTWSELAAAAMSGVVRPAPASSDVPPALRKLVLQALRVDPQERWPSMSTLLGALENLLARKLVAEPADPELRAQAAALRRALEEAGALADGGHYDDALPRLKAIASDAVRLGHPPLAADALYALGTLQTSIGELRGAEKTLGDAVVEAARARDDSLSARIWSELVLLIGHRAGRIADALLLRPAAEAAFVRCDDDTLAQGQYFNMLGLDAVSRGLYEESFRAFHRAAEVFEGAAGATSPQLGRAVSNACVTLRVLGRYREARAYGERACLIMDTALGPEHPVAAMPLNNLGEVLADEGDHAAALAYHTRALAIRRRALGAEHPHLALSVHNIGLALLALGRTEEAREHLEQAHAIRIATLAASSPEIADSLCGLGAVALAGGDWHAALERFTQARAIIEALPAAREWRLARIEDHLGEALRAAGRTDEARTHHERARSLIVEALGADHPHVARSLVGIAACE